MMLRCVVVICSCFFYVHDTVVRCVDYVIVAVVVIYVCVVIHVGVFWLTLHLYCAG